jgi:acetate kinase
MTYAARPAVGVINAGSSSLKASLFTVRAGDVQLEQHAQIDGLGATPRLVIKDAAGVVRTKRSWHESHGFGHDAAIEHVLGWLH